MSLSRLLSLSKLPWKWNDRFFSSYLQLSDHARIPHFDQRRTLSKITSPTIKDLKENVKQKSHIRKNNVIDVVSMGKKSMISDDQVAFTSGERFPAEKLTNKAGMKSNYTKQISQESEIQKPLTKRNIEAAHLINLISQERQRIKPEIEKTQPQPKEFNQTHKIAKPSKNIKSKLSTPIKDWTEEKRGILHTDSKPEEQENPKPTLTRRSTSSAMNKNKPSKEVRRILDLLKEAPSNSETELESTKTILTNTKIDEKKTHPKVSQDQPFLNTNKKASVKKYTGNLMNSRPEIVVPGDTSRVIPSQPDRANVKPTSKVQIDALLNMVNLALMEKKLEEQRFPPTLAPKFRYRNEKDIIEIIDPYFMTNASNDPNIGYQYLQAIRHINFQWNNLSIPTKNHLNKFFLLYSHGINNVLHYSKFLSSFQQMKYSWDDDEMPVQLKLNILTFLTNSQYFEGFSNLSDLLRTLRSLNWFKLPFEELPELFRQCLLKEVKQHLKTQGLFPPNIISARLLANLFESIATLGITSKDFIGDNKVGNSMAMALRDHWELFSMEWKARLIFSCSGFFSNYDSLLFSFQNKIVNITPILLMNSHVISNFCLILTGLDKLQLSIPSRKNLFPSACIGFQKLFDQKEEDGDDQMADFSLAFSALARFAGKIPSVAYPKEIQELIFRKSMEIFENGSIEDISHVLKGLAMMKIPWHSLSSEEFRQSIFQAIRKNQASLDHESTTMILTAFADFGLSFSSLPDDLIGLIHQYITKFPASSIEDYGLYVNDLFRSLAGLQMKWNTIPQPSKNAFIRIIRNIYPFLTSETVIDLLDSFRIITQDYQFIVLPQDTTMDTDRSIFQPGASRKAREILIDVNNEKLPAEALNEIDLREFHPILMAFQLLSLRTYIYCCQSDEKLKENSIQQLKSFQQFLSTRSFIIQKIISREINIVQRDENYMYPYSKEWKKRYPSIVNNPLPHPEEHSKDHGDDDEFCIEDFTGADSEYVLPTDDRLLTKSQTNNNNNNNDKNHDKKNGYENSLLKEIQKRILKAAGKKVHHGKPLKKGK